MKLSSVCLMGLLLLASCNNGPYDAHPMADLDKGQYPIDTSGNGGNGGSGGSGGGATDCTPDYQLPISHKANDTAWIGSSGLVISKTEASGDTTLVLQAVGDYNGVSFTTQLEISKYTGVKSYDLGPGSDEGTGGWFNNTGTQIYSTDNSGDGVVNILRDNDTLEGRYYFIAKDPTGKTVRICGGYFKDAN